MSWFRRGKRTRDVSLNINLSPYSDTAASALWDSMHRHSGEASYPWAELDRDGQALVRQVAADVVRAVAPGLVHEAVHSALACVGLRPAKGVEVEEKGGEE